MTVIHKVRSALTEYYWKQRRRIDEASYLRHALDNYPYPEEIESLQEDLACLETDDFVRRGRRVDITLSGLPEGELPRDVWKTTSEGERGYLAEPFLTKFKELVKGAEDERNRRRRERRELWIKWFTLLAAAIAAFASVYVALSKK